MLISEIFERLNELRLCESVFTVLDNIPTRPSLDDVQTLAALVMYIQINNERPGVVQLHSFYLDDNTAFLAELKRISQRHPDEFSKASYFVSKTPIDKVIALIRDYFGARQHNRDLVVPPARPQGPRSPTTSRRWRSRQDADCGSLSFPTV